MGFEVIRSEFAISHAPEDSGHSLPHATLRQDAGRLDVGRLDAKKQDAKKQDAERHDFEQQKPIRYVLDSGNAFLRAPHPNFTVLLEDDVEHTPTATAQLQPGATELAAPQPSAGEGGVITRSSGLLPTYHAAYQPRHDLTISPNKLGAERAARRITDAARAFERDCRRGMIGPFRGEHFFLSNMYPTAVRFGGVTYSCSESAYQAQKTGDPELRERISHLDGKAAKKLMSELASNPSEAAPKSDEVIPKLSEIVPKLGWGSVCVDVMERVLLAKFTPRRAPQPAAHTTPAARRGPHDTWPGHLFARGEELEQVADGRIFRCSPERLR